jgi:hypothetical protein
MANELYKLSNQQSLVDTSIKWGDAVHNPEAGLGTHAVPPFPHGDVPYKLA